MEEELTEFRERIRDYENELFGLSLFCQQAKLLSPRKDLERIGVTFVLVPKFRTVW